MLENEIKRASVQAKMLGEMYSRLAEAIQRTDFLLVEELSEDIRTMRERLEKNTGLEF